VFLNPPFDPPFGTERKDGGAGHGDDTRRVSTGTIAQTREWKAALAYLVIQGVARPPLRWLVWPPLALYFWIYQRLFPQRFETRLARGEAGAKAFSDWIELTDPELFETATGRKARPASEIPPPYNT
jgi:hypothetical protein